MNTSYEDMEEEATPSPVNVGAGEKMELFVHFHNSCFGPGHIHYFLLDSQMDA
jgi:hypothetical protein